MCCILPWASIKRFGGPETGRKVQRAKTAYRRGRKRKPEGVVKKKPTTLRGWCEDIS